MCSTQTNTGAAVGLQHERARFITTKKILSGHNKLLSKEWQRIKGFIFGKISKVEKCENAKNTDLL